MKSEKEMMEEAGAILYRLSVQHPDLAERIHPVRIVLSRRMTNCAGKALHSKNTVKLSVPFFADEKNFQEEFENTLTHEIAHLLAPSLREYPGQRREPHGPAWRAMHCRLGGTGERCHSMEVAEAFQRERKARPDVEVPCPKCGKPFKLGPTQYNRHMKNLQLGGIGYRHRFCT